MKLAFVFLAVFMLQSQPWHQGAIHIGCNRFGKPHQGHESDKQVKEWRRCYCRHDCEIGNEETNNRKWDAKCEARCSANHCHCPHPCEGF